MNVDDGPADAPRPGFRGVWDRLVGPGATTTETALVVGVALTFPIGLLGYAHLAQLEWRPVQAAVVFVVAVDVAGGIVATTTRSGSRWWHRPDRTNRHHLTFVTAHVHPFVLAAVFAGFTWYDATIVYGFLLASAAVVVTVPLALTRPVATIAFAAGLLVALYWIDVPVGVEWFVPFLYLKLLLGHLVNGGQQ